MRTIRSSRTRLAPATASGALALVLAATWAPRGATAQNGPARLRGEYGLVGGELASGNANAIYVLDAANQELIALRWNPGSGAGGELQSIGYRDLRLDAVARPSR